jgi:5-methylcytosine-specific restriction endonuclease McrA
MCEKHANRERYCATPGCPNKITSGRFCEQCLKNQQQLKEERRGSARKRGYDKTWEKASKLYRSANPICERCLSRGKYNDKDLLVHHIKPLKEGGARLDFNNLQTLCRSCHKAIHKEMDRKRKDKTV